MLTWSAGYKTFFITGRCSAEPPPPLLLLPHIRPVADQVGDWRQSKKFSNCHLCVRFCVIILSDTFIIYSRLAVILIIIVEEDVCLMTLLKEQYKLYSILVSNPLELKAFLVIFPVQILMSETSV